MVAHGVFKFGSVHTSFGKRAGSDPVYKSNPAIALKRKQGGSGDTVEFNFGPPLHS
jgi:hypothetical protein